MHLSQFAHGLPGSLTTSSVPGEKWKRQRRGGNVLHLLSTKSISNISEGNCAEMIRFSKKKVHVREDCICCSHAKGIIQLHLFGTIKESDPRFRRKFALCSIRGAAAALVKSRVSPVHTNEILQEYFGESKCRHDVLFCSDMQALRKQESLQTNLKQIDHYHRRFRPKSDLQRPVVLGNPPLESYVKCLKCPTTDAANYFTGFPVEFDDTLNRISKGNEGFADQMKLGKHKRVQNSE